MNASTTADNVSITGGSAIEKNESTEFPAVASICASASALIKFGKSVDDTKYELEPATSVDPYAINTVISKSFPAPCDKSAIPIVT